MEQSSGKRRHQFLFRRPHKESLSSYVPDTSSVCAEDLSPEDRTAEIKKLVRLKQDAGLLPRITDSELDTSSVRGVTFVKHKVPVTKKSPPPHLIETHRKKGNKA